ncbi:unnamed protein product [Nesidiocoris tenuis]|uniref:Nidogen n=1 Tax=Nesidiocoris tenuis TaxID=355587 RepID=A0A6H5GVQ7_9HEMI|nr:unnamed protein product [Nesidiocoris tenuis]
MIDNISVIVAEFQFRHCKNTFLKILVVNIFVFPAILTKTGRCTDHFLPPYDDFRRGRKIYIIQPNIMQICPLPFQNITVSTNGLVSFLTPVERYINIQFPLNIPVIAPLYANADTSRGGQVYYRESNREADLSKSDATLRKHFRDLGPDFEPLGLFIVTWERIPMHGADPSESDKVNTFQLAITTDREISFVEFLYHDGGIQWIQAPNANPFDSLPPVRAQAGIISPSGRLFTLRGSGTDQVMNLDNVCGSVTDKPIRLSGPLSINVNGVRLENFIFEGYVVVKDGRVYTAVDKLPPDLTPSLQLLKPLESLPGWLFALTEDPNKKNGFQLTGGVVNHTATLTFSNSYVLRLHQIYKGPDAYDQIKVEVDISGRIPEISAGGSIKQNEHYDEIYTKTEPVAEDPCIKGRVQCVANSSCLVQDDSFKCVCNSGYEIHTASNDFGIVCQDIDECSRLSQVCSTYADCINFEGGFECRCHSGFHGDGRYCDQDSCHVLGNCHSNAMCIPVMKVDGGYRCMCNPGYEGDGYNCTESELSCHDADICHKNAICMANTGQGSSHVCICSEGFIGDGFICYPSDPAACDQCDPNADCVQKNGVYDCQCKDNFIGDGLTCSPEVQDCDTRHDCDFNADCLYATEVEGYRCFCSPGFTGDGHSCQEIITCARDPSICDENARCLFLDSKYKCTCNEGYFGNGTICKGITTDCVEGKVYWSDITGAQIKRAKYDGSEFEEFLDTTGESPEGLALDWINRQLYWVDPLTDKISTINLDTKEVRVIIDRNLTNPRGIAVHPFRRKLYWSDWNRAAPKIEESNLDGSQRRDLVTGADIRLPNALTIDWDKDELCWSDAGTKTIDCMYLNRRVPNTVVSEVPYPFGIAISSDKYYWSDWNTSKIMSAPKHNGLPIASIDVPLGGDDKPNGLTIVAACPR